MNLKCRRLSLTVTIFLSLIISMVACTSPESSPVHITNTQAPTVTPAPLPTSTPEPASTPTPQATPTLKPTVTPAPLPTSTPEPASTPTPQATPTLKPTVTPEPTVTPAPLPTSAPEPALTPTPQATPTLKPTVTPAPLPTSTPEPESTSRRSRLLRYPPLPQNLNRRPLRKLHPSSLRTHRRRQGRIEIWMAARGWTKTNPRWQTGSKRFLGSPTA